MLTLRQFYLNISAVRTIPPPDVESERLSTDRSVLQTAGHFTPTLLHSLVCNIAETKNWSVSTSKQLSKELAWSLPVRTR